MPSDTAIRSSVEDVLRNEPRVNASDITVAVGNGVVALSGEVNTASQQHAIVHAVRNVIGVHGIVDQIRVRSAVDANLDDLDIAGAALTALLHDTGVPANTIKVRVQDKRLWLVGEAESELQKAAAERAVRNIPGVREFYNIVRIRPRRATGP